MDHQRVNKQLLIARFLRLFLQSVFTLSVLSACASSGDKSHSQATYLEGFKQSNNFTTQVAVREDGLQINAREFGLAHRDKAPTLLLMHGFPDNQHLYDLAIPLLAKSRHVISFDFLGWGQSEKPAQHLYDVASQRADIQAIVRHFKLSNMALIVHDLSGQAGIDWALENSESVHSLVLLNTYYNNMPTLKAPDAIDLYSKPGLLRSISTWGANKVGSRFEAGLASQIGKFFSNPQAREKFVPIISYESAAIRPAFFSSTAVLWQEIAERDKKTRLLSTFQKPVHLIFGADDPYLNTGVAKSFAQAFPNTSLALIEKAGHYVQLDEPDRVSQLILAKTQVK